MDYFTLKQVSEKFSVSEKTISRLVKAGKLQSFRVGNKTLVTQEQLDNYIASNIVQPPTKKPTPVPRSRPLAVAKTPKDYFA